MPYIEQGPLYDRFDQTANSYSVNTSLTLNRVDVYLCPSSRSNYWGFGYVGTLNYTVHYQGIMGPQGTNPATGAVYTGTNPAYTSSAYAYDGGRADQGILRTDACTPLGGITDGTSNTYVLGELSYENAGVHREWNRGLVNGPSCTNKNIEFPIMTMNWPAFTLNTPIGLPGYPTLPVHWNDVPFGSMHPGGPHFAYADGSVRMVSGLIDMKVYLASASRNGGEPIAADQ